MKVWKRILIKTVILAAVIAAGGGAAASYQAYRQSSAEYVVNHYLTLLIDNSQEKAYACLDQSEAEMMTAEVYEKALDAKKYSLYSSCDVTKEENRRDSNGNEYVDYHAKFKDAGGEVKAEENFTVKKQADQVYGLFDRWKVLSTHCMVTDFMLTVPAGSEVYIGGQLADGSWIDSKAAKASCDTYDIPTLIPGSTSLVIRHPVLESVNGMLDTETGSADYTDKMALKETGQSACKELGVKFLKAVYTSAVKAKTEDSEKVLADVSKEAETLIKNQEADFHSDDAAFHSVGISDFAVQFGNPVFTDDPDGAIQTEITFSYHYAIQEDIMVDTDELQEDGTPVQQTETVSTAGDATAKFTMSYYDDAWHITAFEMPVIPEER